MPCISESELVQLDEDAMRRLSRSLHAVRDVSVPAAARVTRSSQEECHRSPKSLQVHHSRVDPTKARADCVRALTQRLGMQWSPKQKVPFTGIASFICCERRVASFLRVCIVLSTLLLCCCAAAGCVSSPGYVARTATQILVVQNGEASAGSKHK